MIVATLINDPISKCILKRSKEKLTGRALSCAINAWNHLCRAQEIAHITPTISFFCVTHATEEAVAAVVSSAKANGYASLANKINLHNHMEKAVVAAFAQILSGLLVDKGLSFAYSPKTDILYMKTKGHKCEEKYPLSLHQFSFNKDGNDPSSEAAHETFLSFFPDTKTMKNYVKDRATFRDKALYAANEGAPSMSQSQLNISLREYTLITLGLLWAATDLTYHEENEPFVQQTLGAILLVIKEFKRARRCPQCEQEFES